MILARARAPSSRPLCSGAGPGARRPTHPIGVLENSILTAHPTVSQRSGSILVRFSLFLSLPNDSTTILVGVLIQHRGAEGVGLQLVNNQVALRNMPIYPTRRLLLLPRGWKRQEGSEKRGEDYSEEGAEGDWQVERGREEIRAQLQPLRHCPKLLDSHQLGARNATSNLPPRRAACPFLPAPFTASMILHTHGMERE